MKEIKTQAQNLIDELIDEGYNLNEIKKVLSDRCALKSKGYDKSDQKVVDMARFIMSTPISRQKVDI